MRSFAAGAYIIVAEGRKLRKVEKKTIIKQ